MSAGGACCQQKTIICKFPSGLENDPFKSASLFTGFYDGRD